MAIKQTLQFESKVEEKVFSVSEFLDFLNEILKPQKAIIQGEIGNKISKRLGYSIFNLLDKKDNSVLKCFIWEGKIKNLGVELEEGMEVKVSGYPKIYKSPYGSGFEFEVEQIYLIGEGVLKKAFENLKNKLEKEGLFLLERKKPIPRFCERIGLITSKYGKGAKPDFEKHLVPFGFKVYFYDVRVEGMSAISQIVEAIQWFNKNMLDLDVLILIRGGGDWESLQAFNSEEVVRAIASSRIPVICGVGHESDITLADLAADLRASTPTDAAKILSENWKLAATEIYKFEKNLNFIIKRDFQNIKQRINSIENNLKIGVQKEISLRQKRLEDQRRNLNLSFKNYFKGFEILEKEFQQNIHQIVNLIKNQKIKIQEISERLLKNKNQWQEKIKRNLKQEEEKLIINSPLLKLKQGYTITLNEEGKIIKNAEKLKIEQLIKTKFCKGQILSKIKKIEK